MKAVDELRALFGLTLAVLAVGCSVNEDVNALGASTLPGPAEWNRDVIAPSDAEAESARLSCSYVAGALPAETQGETHPMGDEIPVDHIVVMMMENRSFDHYFSRLPAYGQPDVDVAPEGFTNPDVDGSDFAPYHDKTYCLVDTNHGWNGTHRQINDGAMDGFIATNDGNHEKPVNGTLEMVRGTRALSFYDETDIPFYYWLANDFTIADRYFAAVPGPTWPNRMYLFAASSFGAATNSLRTADETIFDNLEKRGVTWKIYADGAPSFTVFPAEYFEYREAHVFSMADFEADAAAGTLPSVAFVEPYFGVGGYDRNDEHPPAVMQIGQRLVAQTIDTLTKSPLWSSSAMFLMYDEHGGYFDHVPPPKACHPGNGAAELDEGDEPGDFDQYGVRVPMMLISPFAKKHYVSHRVFDHTSIIRFIEARFVMPAMSNRDANAEAPWDMFDFDGAPHATPPSVPVPSIDEAALAACAAVFEE